METPLQQIKQSNMPSDFLEATIETILFENKDRLIDRGFESFYRNTERQLRLPSGKIMDLFTWEVDDTSLKAKVIELKKDDGDEAAFWQGLKYLEEVFMHTLTYFSEINIELIIVGRRIPYNVLCVQSLGVQNLRLYEYSYNWDGISFKEQDFKPHLMVEEANSNKYPPINTEDFSLMLMTLSKNALNNLLKD